MHTLKYVIRMKTVKKCIMKEAENGYNVVFLLIINAFDVFMEQVSYMRWDETWDSIIISK